MKNSYWLWIALAVSILIAFWYFNSDYETGSVVDKDTTQTTLKQTTTNSTKQSSTATTPAKVEQFTSIFPSTGNYECNYEEVTPSYRASNTIYFSSGKMRGEFRVMGGSSSIMVYDGRYMYKWTEGKTTGTVSIPKSISDFPPIIPKDITQGVVLGAGINNASWNCHAWSVNKALLEKPTFVSFN